MLTKETFQCDNGHWWTAFATVVEFDDHGSSSYDVTLANHWEDDCPSCGDTGDWTEKPTGDEVTL